MTEFIGLAYFAEIPGHHHRRAARRARPPACRRAPSSPTCSPAPMPRTATPNTCCCFPQDPHRVFRTFTAAALDLADRLQTPIFLMTDLDIGMNQRLCAPFAMGRRAWLYDRGKVMTRPRNLKPARTSAATRTSTATASRMAHLPGTHATQRRALLHPRHDARPVCAATRSAAPTTSTTWSGCCASSTRQKKLVPQPGAAQGGEARPALGVDLFTARPARPCMRRSTCWTRQGRSIYERAAPAGLPVPGLGATTSSPSHDTCVRGRTEPRRADALADRQRTRRSIRRVWSCRCCTTTARRSRRASSSSKYPHHAAAHRASGLRRWCHERKLAVTPHPSPITTEGSQHDLSSPSRGCTTRTLPTSTRSATRGATTRAGYRPCAPAAATTRFRRRSSRPAGSSTSSRTASPNCRVSAAARKRRTTSSAPRTASTPCTAACRRC